MTYVEKEESYTSKADFFSNDTIPTYDRDITIKYKFSGNLNMPLRIRVS